MPRQRLQEHPLCVAVAEGYVRLRSDRNPACTTASVPDAASFHSTAATKVFKALTATTTPLLVAVAEGYVRLRSDRNPACTTASFADAASFHSTAATRVFKAHIAASCLVSDYNSAFRSSCRRLRPVAQRPYSGVHDGFGSGRSLVSLDSCYEGFQRVLAPFSPRNICPDSVKLRNLSKASGSASSSG